MIITIPLDGGLDTQSDVESSTFTELINFERNNPGKLVKRSGLGDGTQLDPMYLLLILLTG